MRAKRKMIRLRIQEIAESKGITRTMLSRRAEVNYDTLNKLWHNTHSSVNLAHLVRIARVLNVPVESLYEEIPDNAQ